MQVHDSDVGGRYPCRRPHWPGGGQPGAARRESVTARRGPPRVKGQRDRLRVVRAFRTAGSTGLAEDSPVGVDLNELMWH